MSRKKLFTIYKKGKQVSNLRVKLHVERKKCHNAHCASSTQNKHTQKKDSYYAVFYDPAQFGNPADIAERRTKYKQPVDSVVIYQVLQAHPPPKKKGVRRRTLTPKSVI